MTGARKLLDDLFRTAVAAVHPAACLRPGLPQPPPAGRLVILAAGKAAGSMVEVAEQHYRDTLGLPGARLTGLGVTRHGYGRPTRAIPVVEAGHPIPDEQGVAAARETLALARGCGPDDLVLVLLSGGASANWIAPAAGLALAEKQTVTRALLRCGGTIGEINTVRKHLSAIKGGRLAALAAPAQVVTLAISDVPGDDPAVIGSGPSVPDPTTLADARAVIARYGLQLPDAVMTALLDPANESFKPDNPVFTRTQFKLIATPASAFEAASARARAMGYDCVVLGDRIEGEAAVVAAEHAALARQYRAQGRRAIILSGGELTVTIRGSGRGGPNQEYALALAISLAGTPGVAVFAADTDGTDGGAGSADDPAGAFVDVATLTRAGTSGLDPAVFLRNNDSTTFFERVGDLIRTGPTFTNVNDFRAILVDNP
jgi:glycerate 2-kinase